MVIVSLTTDWGNKGLYSGLFKAKLVNKKDNTRIDAFFIFSPLKKHVIKGFRLFDLDLNFNQFS